MVDDADAEICADARGIDCSSLFLGVVVLPNPSKDPPKIICPLGAFVIVLISPLKPANGRLVQPDVQAIALVELPPANAPPTYTVPELLSQYTLVTFPLRPGNGVIAEVFGLNKAIPWASTPPKLVKLPPTTTPGEGPFLGMKGHMDFINPSAFWTDANAPLGSRASRLEEPFVLKPF